MALGDPYVTAAELKTYKGITVTNASLEVLLENAVQSASNDIETYCNRQFNRADVATPRLFPVRRYTDLIKVDDFWSSDGLVVQHDLYGDGVSVTTIDNYVLEPLNGVVDGQIGWPYWKIRLRYAQSFTGYIRVTAKWGWEEVPDSVRQATYILANETYQIKDAPFGVAGTDQWGTIRIRENPLIEKKIRKYVRDKILIG